jgi:hypothetical protein
MSAIHQALKQAQSDEPRHSSYNPLADKVTPRPKQTTNSYILYWLLAGAFIALVPIVIFWPAANPTSPATTSPVRAAQVTLSNSNTVSEDITSADTIDTTSLNNTAPGVEEVAVVQALPVDVIADPIAKPEPKVVIEPNQSVATRQDAASNPQAIKKVQIISETIETERIQEPPKAPALVQPQTPTPSLSEPTQIITVSAQKWQTTVEQHLARDELEQAEAVLKQWISASPKDESPRIWLARIYLSNNFYSSAEPLLTQLTSSEALALKGILYEKTKQYPLAVAQFSELFQRQPDNGKWLLMWAINSENSGKLAKSFDLYQTYVNSFRYEDADLTTFAQQRLNALEGR